MIRTEMVHAKAGVIRHLTQLRLQRCEACDGFGHASKICPTYFATTHIDPHDRHTREVLRLVWTSKEYKNVGHHADDLGWSMLPRGSAYRAKITPGERTLILGKRKRVG